MSNRNTQHAAENILQPTTETILKVMGLLPDQTRARQMMEAARLWLPITATQDQINSAWLRRLVYGSWRQFSVERYDSLFLRHRYGGAIPDSIRAKIKMIQSALPREKVVIHAKAQDPWVVVDGHIVAGWMRDGRDDRVTILL